MRRENSIATPALYDGIAATPGPLTDSPNYNVNSVNNPACLALNFGAQAFNVFWTLLLAYLLFSGLIFAQPVIN